MTPIWGQRPHRSKSCSNLHRVQMERFMDNEKLFWGAPIKKIREPGEKGQISKGAGSRGPHLTGSLYLLLMETVVQFIYLSYLCKSKSSLESNKIKLPVTSERIKCITRPQEVLHLLHAYMTVDNRDVSEFYLRISLHFTSFHSKLFQGGTVECT